MRARLWDLTTGRAIRNFCSQDHWIVALQIKDNTLLTMSKNEIHIFTPLLLPPPPRTEEDEKPQMVVPVRAPNQGYQVLLNFPNVPFKVMVHVKHVPDRNSATSSLPPVCTIAKTVW